MKRATLGTTLLTLFTFAAAGCAADAPTGPSAPADRPSVLGNPSPDRNGNGVWCIRNVGNDPNFEPSVSPQMFVRVSIDDDSGACPQGFRLFDPRV